MIYQKEQIMRDVRVALDLNMSSEALVGAGDIDTLSLDQVIESKIEEGVRRVHLSAPVWMLESGHHFGDSLFWGEEGSGWVLLPDDFLRLVTFRMSDWERGVHRAYACTDPMYARQRSRYKGIRGTCQKPVCVIAVRPEGRVLEFYSCKSRQAEVSEGVYVPEPAFDRHGGVDISERCYRAVVYRVAALVAASFGDAAKAQLYEGLSNDSLG